MSVRLKSKCNNLSIIVKEFIQSLLSLSSPSKNPNPLRLEGTFFIIDEFEMLCLLPLPSLFLLFRNKFQSMAEYSKPSSKRIKISCGVELTKRAPRNADLYYHPPKVDHPAANTITHDSLVV